MNTRDQYVEKLKAKLDEWNSEIERLEKRAQQNSETAKQEIANQLTALKEKRDRGSKKLEELEGATSEAWESLKIGAMLVWDDITDTVSHTKESFQEGLQSGQGRQK